MKETIYYIPGAPRIAVIGDFHNNDYSAIVSSLRHHRFDMICIPGDLVCATFLGRGSLLETQKNIVPLLNTCVELAPTFMSLGNHESILMPEDQEAIQSLGVVILDNAWVCHNNIFIGGLTSHYVLNRRAFRLTHPDEERHVLHIMQYKDWKPIEDPDLSWLEPVPSGYTVLLSHHPEYHPKLPKVDLVLAAHAHGGQWNIFGHGFYAPGQGYFPKWTSGLYGNMLVTRGLANTANIPRINNPMEIV